MSTGSGAHLRESTDPVAASGDRDGLSSGVVTAASLDDGADAATDGILVLIAALCRSLEADRVRYCHWKSNESIARSASGENDLDPLVARADAERFELILRRLGFKDTDQPAWKRLPGIYHSYGLDPTGVFVHIHAHYQLVIGDDMTKNIHLPIEAPYLASARSEGTFPIPSTAFELLLFLIRMVVKHSTWDAFVSFQGSLSKSERRELEDLVERTDLHEVWELAERHLPFIPREILERCLRCVQPGASRWLRDPDGVPPATRARGLQPTAAGPRYGSAHVEARPDCASAKGPPSGARHESDVLRRRVGRHRGRRRGREDDRGGRALELARLRAHRLLDDALGEAVVVRAHGYRQGLAEARRGDETDLDVVREGVAVVPVHRRGRVDRAEPGAPRLGGPHGSRSLPHVSEGATSRHERGDRDLRPISAAGGLPDGRSGDRPVAGIRRPWADGPHGWPDSSDATTSASGIPTP